MNLKGAGEKKKKKRKRDCCSLSSFMSSSFGRGTLISEQFCGSQFDVWGWQPLCWLVRKGHIIEKSKGAKNDRNDSSAETPGRAMSDSSGNLETWHYTHTEKRHTPSCEQVCLLHFHLYCCGLGVQRDQDAFTLNLAKPAVCPLQSAGPRAGGRMAWTLAWAQGVQRLLSCLLHWSPWGGTQTI